jgi:tetratricopeptide (TPR) repeat protein
MALNRLQFLLTHKSEALDRLSQNHQNPEILNFFVEDQKFYLVEEFIPGHPLNPPSEPGQLQAEDPGVLRLQEMLQILGPTPEPVQGQSLTQISPQQPAIDSESFQPTPVISSPEKPPKPQSLKLVWLILAGGIALVVVVVGSMLLFQSQNQIKAKEFYNQGVEKLNKSDRQGAIKAFDEAIRLNSKDPLFYGNRGNAHYDMGAYKGAIEDYSKMIQLDPNNAGAYYNRAVARYDLEDWKGALDDLKPIYSAPVERCRILL